MSDMSVSLAVLSPCIARGGSKMRLLSLFKLIGFIRLVIAQDSLLPPDFKEKAPFWLKALRKLFTFGTKKFDQDSRGVELSKKLQSLGPTYIKLGQSLATRPRRPKGPF